jgi:subtilisin family serine protease
MLLLAAAAVLTASAGGAFAQKVYSRSPGFGGAPAQSGARNGGYRGGGFRSGGWTTSVPGLILSLPTGPQYIDDGPGAPPPAARRAPRRGSSGAPPANERRLVPDEVIVEIANSISPQAINSLERRHRLTRVEQQTFQLSGTTLYRWRIADRRSVTSVVRALENEAVVASAQPNYLFTLQQAASSASEGDPAQYELAKLHLPQAHAIAKGDEIPVAIIDSAVDIAHPDLAGTVTQTFDAVGTAVTPHKHGTAIAGLIAAHGRLVGAAPGAKILAVRAFDPAGASAEGTTFNILKGLDWATANGARVINMSFAGPADPALHRSLEAAHKKNIVLVAAVGNAGPRSPPLYPAADANVIAVTATDADDRLFPQSNRGPFIALAAPGAEVLVAIPDGGYEASSGTSYSAAEISGIAALMLQHKPDLKPDQLRALLMATAKDLGPKGRDSLFGAGLADAYAALTAEAATAAAQSGKHATSGAR